MLTGNQKLKQLAMTPVEEYFCWVLWKKSILSPPGKKLDSSLPCSTSNAWGYSCIIFTCCKNQCTSHRLSIKLQLPSALLTLRDQGYRQITLFIHQNNLKPFPALLCLGRKEKEKAKGKKAHLTDPPRSNLQQKIAESYNGLGLNGP